MKNAKTTNCSRRLASNRSTFRPGFDMLETREAPSMLPMTGTFDPFDPSIDPALGVLAGLVQTQRPIAGTIEWLAGETPGTETHLAVLVETGLRSLSCEAGLTAQCQSVAAVVQRTGETGLAQQIPSHELARPNHGLAAVSQRTGETGLTQQIPSQWVANPSHELSGPRLAESGLVEDPVISIPQRAPESGLTEGGFQSVIKPETGLRQGQEPKSGVVSDPNYPPHGVKLPPEHGFYQCFGYGMPCPW